MGKFVIRLTEKGARFNLKAGNGQVIATSQLYKSLATCKIGVASVAKNAPIANIEDLTLEEPEPQINPKFEVYMDKAGEYRFRLKARNGQNIAASEGYTSKKSCFNGIESVRKNATDATVEIEEA